MREVGPSRRILLVCLDNLGDLAFASALVPPLRRAFPRATISVWSKEYASGLLAFIPGLSRNHACDPFWDRSPGARPGSVLGFLRTLREVAAADYDTVLIPNTRRRTALAAWMAAVPRRIGFAQRGATPWLTDAVEAERRDRPIVSEWARLLSPLKADAGKPAIHLEVPASLEGERREMLRRLGPGPVVGIHPFSGDERRSAPLAFWREVLAGLPSLGVAKVLVAGRREEAEDFVASVGLHDGLELVVAGALGSGGLESVLIATSLCRAFVGNDSGPLHCASGLGVPVLGLYLPGDWPRAMPQGRGPWRDIRRAVPLEASPRDALAHVRGLLEAAD